MDKYHYPVLQFKILRMQLAAEEPQEARALTI